MNRVMNAPDVWGDVWPVNQINEYLITTEQMQAFIEAKACAYCPNTKVRVLPFYTQVPNKDKKEKLGKPSRTAYAAPLIMISDNVQIKKPSSWLTDMVDDENPRVERQIWGEIIRLYKFDRSYLVQLLRSKEGQRLINELDETRGMDEDYFRAMAEYSIVRPVKTNNDRWLTFLADPEAICKDMLRDRTTKEFHGRLESLTVTPISDTIVAYSLYVHLDEKEEIDNMELRQIMSRMNNRKR